LKFLAGTYFKEKRSEMNPSMPLQVNHSNKHLFN
jgi:hypothetical protein